MQETAKLASRTDPLVVLSMVLLKALVAGAGRAANFEAPHMQAQLQKLETTPNQ
jgi:hypothetical protein